MEYPFYIVSPLHKANEPRSETASTSRSTFVTDVDVSLLSHALTTAYTTHTGALIATGVLGNSDMTRLQNRLRSLKLQQQYENAPPPEFRVGLNLLDEPDELSFTSGRSSKSITVSGDEQTGLRYDLQVLAGRAFPSYDKQKEDLFARETQTADPESKVCGFITAYIQKGLEGMNYSTRAVLSEFDELPDKSKNHYFLIADDSKGGRWIIDATYKQFLLQNTSREELNQLPDVMAIKVTNVNEMEQRLNEHGIDHSLRHIWMNVLTL